MTPPGLLHVLHHLDYVPVIVISIIGFAFGALWFAPPVFGKAWKEEVKLPDEQCKSGSARKLIGTFLCTIVLTVALDVLFSRRGTEGLLAGAKFGLLLGVGIAAALHVPITLFDGRSCRYRAIVVGHEVVLSALLGAILGVWR